MEATQVVVPTSSEAGKYRAILEKKIAEGAASAAATLEAVHRDVPKDQIAKERSITFHTRTNDGVQFPSLIVDVGGEILTPSDYALGQVSARAGVPHAYVRSMVDQGRGEGEGWRRDLVAHALNQHFVHAGEDRVLVRSVRGQMRGMLSDRFRRIDSRPLLDALCAELQKFGAVPYFGTATETRVALKALLPQIIEPVPGEFLVRGMEWSNSDYGNGTHSMRAFALRVACLNGMTRENLLREIHLGKRLGDDVSYSERTYQLDTRASVSALKDITRHALGPAGLDALTNSIRAAAGRDYNERQLQGVTKNLPKSTAKSIVDAFKSEDVINLPAGPSAWRASNAISWIARHTDNPETRLDLERLAGQVV